MEVVGRKQDRFCCVRSYFLVQRGVLMGYVQQKGMYMKRCALDSEVCLYMNSAV